MYGHNSRGIRIRLPINFIKSYKVRTQIQESGGSISYGNCFDSIISEEKLFTSDHFVANYNAVSNKFFPMEYTDDLKLLIPPILNQSDDDGLVVMLGALGGHKPTIWGFEQEWRFKLIIYPLGIKQIDPMDTLPMRRALEEEKKLDFEEYFLEISDEAYSKMEVRLGPLCAESDEIMVEALIQKYNPAALALLNPSDLKERVR